MRDMRPGRSFRVILHAEQRQVAVAAASLRLIVQVYVGQFDFGLRQRVGIDREVVIVRRDLDLAGIELFHRMIAAVMSELQLESFAAERKAGELMSEADAEDGLAAHEASDVIDGISTRLGI